MGTLTIEANYRADLSKRRKKQLRREGYATGSVFGGDAEPVSVEVNVEDLIRQVKASEGGTMSLIDMKIKGAPNKSDGIVIIKEFYKDPLTRKLLDLQFQRVNMKQKIHVAVPIEMIGEAPGTREGGMLEQSIDELEISCLPTDIPPRIEVDVSGLDIGNLIRVEDLRLGEDVEILMDPNTVVCNCRPPHVVEEEVVEEEVEELAEGEEGAVPEGEAEAGAEAEGEKPESEGQ